MGKRHPNHRLVKIHRSYGVEDISRLFGIHKNTVQRWIKDGLPTTDNKRPKLVHGHDLVGFLQERRAKNKQTCKPDELYCLRCRAPKLPAKDMVEFSSVTEKFGNLKALCPDCSAIMNRRISIANLSQYYGKMDIAFPKAQEHIIEMGKPSVNSDLK